MSPNYVHPDPTALRALAHPVRLRMLGLLRSEGPSTSTLLAQRLGLNSGATSYHLRNLAQHGFVVEDAERGDARDRWWRAAHQSTSADPDSPDPAHRDAVDAFSQAVAVIHGEQLQRAIEERPLLPERWRRTTTVSDWALRLSPEDGAE
ncbi:MAG: helix-turn-helix domain-containing protein, partial [Actinobacteria bacterium]|nr:helix-turn-helix domain-containing protein [Actinomycetota bacterium]